MKPFYQVLMYLQLYGCKAQISLASEYLTKPFFLKCTDAFLTGISFALEPLIEMLYVSFLWQSSTGKQSASGYQEYIDTHSFKRNSSSKMFV